MGILCNVLVVEIGNAKIEQNIEKKGKVENNKIKAKISCANNVLHGPVNTKYPERLDQNIKKQKKTKIGNKFALHDGQFDQKQARSRLPKIT